MADGSAPTDAGIGARGVRAGLVAALPVLLAVAPFGLIFGVIARESGLDLVETMAMTALVIAGASQLAALQLLADGAPALVAVLAGLVVNLRMAMYSASLALHLGRAPLRLRALAALTLHDQAYALSVARFHARPGEPLSERLGFYFGVGVLTSSVWIGMSLVGATLGRALPESVDLGFVVPVAFIAIMAPMLKGRAAIMVACVSAAVSVGLAGLPFALGLLVGAAVGMITGLAVFGRVEP